MSFLIQLKFEEKHHFDNFVVARILRYFTNMPKCKNGFNIISTFALILNKFKFCIEFDTRLILEYDFYSYN